MKDNEKIVRYNQGYQIQRLQCTFSTHINTFPFFFFTFYTLLIYTSSCFFGITASETKTFLFWK